jgi:hypothetical protein
MTFTPKKILIALGLLSVFVVGGIHGVRAATISSTVPGSVTSGLVGWWTMDGTDMLNGAALDKSGNGNSAALVNIATSTFYRAGKIGQAFNFDGVNDYLLVPSSSSLPAEQPMSISVWVKPDNATAGFVLASRPFSGNGWNITYAFGNRLMFQHDGVGDLSARTTFNFGAFSTTQWTHLVVTWDGTTDATHVLIYKNGVIQAHDTDTNGSSMTSTSGQPLYITSDQGGGGFFKGSMDDFRMYDRVLSTTEISQIYAAGLATGKQAASPQVTGTTSCSTGLSCGLVGYWTFDGKDTPWTSATAATTLDKSGSGNTGTLTSMNQSKAPVQGKIGQGLKFDGVDDTVSIAHNASIKPTAAISINFWFNPSNVNSSAVQTILSTTQSGGYSVALNGTSASGTCNANSFCFFVNVGGTYYITNYAKSNFKNNTWYLFTGTYDGNTNRMYINGQQIDTVSQSGTINYTSNTPVCLASEPNASACIDGNYFNGLMDDVRVYNRALSAVEVRQLYNLGATSKQAVSPVVTSTSCSYGLSCGLLGYWTFDGKDVNWSTGLASDKSGNLNTGSMLNMSTTSSPIPGKSGQGLKFDGANDAINAGSTSSLTDIQNQGGGGMTVAFWINPDSNSTKYILAKGGANNGSGTWSILKASNTNPARLSFNKEGGTDASKNYNSLLVSGVWQHIVLTWDGTMAVSTGVLVYRNGVLVSNVTGTDGASANSDSGNALCMGNLSTIGSANCATSGSADMKLDDVMIYNRVLSAAEVRQLYNRSK